MLKEICQLQLADLTNHDSLNHESIQIRISRYTIAKPANHESNHQDWRFVQALDSPTRVQWKCHALGGLTS